MSSSAMECLPLASVHLDLDGIGEIYRTHGWRHDPTSDPIFRHGLARMLELFESSGVRATLFLVADSLRDAGKREVVEEAVRRGHEIASHTVTHPDLYSLSRAEKRREIERSRQQIEDRLGVPVRGFRAPGYRIDRESLELLEEAGYEYDASAFVTQACAQRLELPLAALEAPGRPYPDRSLIVLPLPDHRPSPVPFSPSYALLLGARYFRWGIARARRRSAPLVLLFHLIDLAPPVPRELLRGLKSRIFTLSLLSAQEKAARCRAMLDLVRQHYHIVPTEELLAPWTGRGRAPRPVSGATVSAASAP